jgi:hypothetical protein
VSYEEQMLVAGDTDQAVIVRNNNIAVTSILFEKSLIFLNKTREW